MGSFEVKPIIPADDIPNKCSLTVSPGVSKLKQSRYEDVWPEDVHAAFMEAVALYPPMGKRRLKYYRVSAHDNDHSPEANRTKSFGRCQLIQSYILEKTGKDRSRKQVSSHLQRLKKIHKDNPAMRPLFSERSQAPFEHCSAPQAKVAIPSGDVFANNSISTRHLKSDPGLTVNLQNADIGGAERLFTFSCSSDTPPLNGGSCNTFNLSTNSQPTFCSPQEFLSPAPQQWFHSSDSGYLSEVQDAFLFKDAMIDGPRASSAFNTPALSISMHRLTSKLPAHSRLADSGPITNFPRALPSPGFQPTSSYPWISLDSLGGASSSCSSSLASAQEVYTPLVPLQLISPEKRLDLGFASEWMWPQDPDIPLGLRDGPFGAARLRYPSAMHEYNPACPGMRVATPGSYGPTPQSEPSRPARGIPSYAVISPATSSESVSNGDAIDLHRQSPGSSVTSPLVVRPTPIYPISYIHPDILL